MRLYNDKSGNGKGAAFVRQTLAEGTLVSATAGEPALVKGLFNAQLSGTFVATLILERSLDNQLTWQPWTASGFVSEFTGPCSESYDEPETGVYYRWRCTSYTSGIIYYRISK